MRRADEGEELGNNGGRAKLAIRVTAKIGEMTMIRVSLLTAAPSFAPAVGSPQEQPMKLHAHVSLLYLHMHAGRAVHIVSVR
jgi:hypothetical protein